MAFLLFREDGEADGKPSKLCGLTWAQAVEVLWWLREQGGECAPDEDLHAFARSIESTPETVEAFIFQVASRAAQDHLHGGLGDQPSFQPVGEALRQAATGLKVETEHTDSFLTSLEIVLDHLEEDPHYYTKLGSLNL